MTPSFLTIAALLPHLGWGCSTVGHWRPKALSLQVGILSPTDSNRVCAGYIIVQRASVSAVLPLFFCLLTPVNLLIDGSVEGQYIANHFRLFSTKSFLYMYIKYIICKHSLLKMFLNKPNLILLHTVKWFQVLLCITNNSINHLSFLHTVKWSNISNANNST